MCQRQAHTQACRNRKMIPSNLHPTFQARHSYNSHNEENSTPAVSIERPKYTRVFFISITDFAWALQCLIFWLFEPQKMLIRCLKFTLTRFTFGMKIGSFGPFLAEWLFCRMHLHNSSLNGTQSQSNIYLKGLFKVKVWISSASVNA